MRPGCAIALACSLAVASGGLQYGSRSQKPSIAIGYGNLVADSGWLRFVQYYGDAASRSQSGYRQSYRYLEAITAADPRFERAYLFANAAVAGRTARPDLAGQLLERGIQAEPLSPALWQARGLLHWIYTGDTRQAAWSFRRAAGLAVLKAGNAAQNQANQWLLLSRVLGCLPSSRWLQRKIWREVYSSAPDSETRRRAATRLTALGVDVFAGGRLQERYALSPPPGYRQYLLYGPQKHPPRPSLTARMNACLFTQAQP